MAAKQKDRSLKVYSGLTNSNLVENNFAFQQAQRRLRQQENNNKFMKAHAVHGTTSTITESTSISNQDSSTGSKNPSTSK